MTDSKLIKSIAMWCVAKATQETYEGNYIIYFKDICKIFEIELDELIFYQYLITDEILRHICVSDVELNECYCFDINLFTDYCFNDID